MYQFAAHSGHILALATSSDGRSLFSAGDEGLIRVWDISRVGTNIENVNSGIGSGFEDGGHEHFGGGNGDAGNNSNRPGSSASTDPPLSGCGGSNPFGQTSKVHRLQPEVTNNDAYFSGIDGVIQCTMIVHATDDCGDIYTLAYCDALTTIYLGCKNTSIQVCTTNHVSPTSLPAFLHFITYYYDAI